MEIPYDLVGWKPSETFTDLDFYLPNSTVCLPTKNDRLDPRYWRKIGRSWKWLISWRKSVWCPQTLRWQIRNNNNHNHNSLIMQDVKLNKQSWIFWTTDKPSESPFAKTVMKLASNQQWHNYQTHLCHPQVTVTNLTQRVFDESQSKQNKRHKRICHSVCGK